MKLIKLDIKEFVNKYIISIKDKFEKLKTSKEKSLLLLRDNKVVKVYEAK